MLILVVRKTFSPLARRAAQELAVGPLGVALVVGGGHVEVVQPHARGPARDACSSQGDRVAAADDLRDHQPGAAQPAVGHAGLPVAPLGRDLVGGAAGVLAFAGDGRRGGREGHRGRAGAEEPATGGHRRRRGQAYRSYPWLSPRGDGRRTRKRLAGETPGRDTPSFQQCPCHDRLSSSFPGLFADRPGSERMSEIGAGEGHRGKNRMRCRVMLALPVLLGLVPGRSDAVELGGTNPNAFLRRGLPTFVVGTSGDDRSDREIRRQAELDPRPPVPGGPDRHGRVDRGGAGPRGMAPQPDPLRRAAGQRRPGEARVHAALPARAGEPHPRGSGVPGRRLPADRRRAGPRGGSRRPRLSRVPALRRHRLARCRRDQRRLARPGADPRGRHVRAAARRRLAGGRRPGGGPRLPARPLPSHPWRAVERNFRSDRGGAGVDVRLAFPAMLPAAADEDRVVAASSAASAAWGENSRSMAPPG